MADVTVVVPTHDRDGYLAEAVGSVLAQEGAALAEVLVCDDRGSGATRALVARLGATAPVPVRYVDTSGPEAGTAGASRNAGARLASSDLVAFLDDDDTWRPAFLRDSLDALAATGADFSVAWLRPDRDDFRMARMRPGLTARDVVARNPGFTGSNFVMRTAAFRVIGGFDPSLPVSNDKDLLVRALLAGMTYAVVPDELVGYRVHSSGQLTDKTPRRLAGIRRYAAKHAGILSVRDRLYLRAQEASVRRALETNPLHRWVETAIVAGQRGLDVLGGSR